MSRALQLLGPGRAELVDVPVPDPGPGQLRIRVEGCGLCGSDLPVLQGRPWFSYPRDPGAPGHEGWGVVDAVGTGVRHVVPGDWVTGLMYRAYAEYDLLEADDAVQLPADLEDRAVPGEPLACAMNVFARSGIEAGQTVAVVGVGFLGALIVQLATAAGARVVAVGRRPDAIETARAVGAVEALLEGPEVPETVARLTDDRGADVVVEAAGTQAALDLASRLTRVRGRLVIAGFHQDGPRQVDLQSWNWQGLDVINAHERDPAVYRHGLALAVAALGDGRLDPAPLFSHRVSLDEPETLIALANERPHDYLKAIVCP